MCRWWASTLLGISLTRDARRCLGPTASGSRLGFCLGLALGFCLGLELVDRDVEGVAGRLVRGGGVLAGCGGGGAGAACFGPCGVGGDVRQLRGDRGVGGGGKATASSGCTPSASSPAAKRSTWSVSFAKVTVTARPSTARQCSIATCFGTSAAVRRRSSTNVSSRHHPAARYPGGSVPQRCHRRAGIPWAGTQVSSSGRRGRISRRRPRPSSDGRSAAPCSAGPRSGTGVCPRPSAAGRPGPC